MRDIGEGKPMHQTVVLRQDAKALMQQFMMYGNSSNYTALQTSPTNITFTRKFWPTWYVVVAVVGLFLCLIGPLILFLSKDEMFTVSLEPEPGGLTRVTVQGLVEKSMMMNLSMMLSHGQIQDAFSPGGSAATGTLSPDGNYRWDGSAWQPARNPPPPT